MIWLGFGFRLGLDLIEIRDMFELDLIWAWFGYDFVKDFCHDGLFYSSNPTLVASGDRLSQIRESQVGC